ncbi:MAG TPA: hypothetical protein VEP67_09810 [Thiobacillaceae bacterium]|nr:hypothetical protein [Thiobacillaceae bacterium]
MMITSVTSPAIQFELSDGLVVVASSDPRDPLLAQFFEFYDRAFILPAEKEEWKPDRKICEKVKGVLEFGPSKIAVARTDGFV